MSRNDDADFGVGRRPDDAVSQEEQTPRPPGWFVRAGTALLGAATFALVSYPVAHGMVDTWSVVSSSSVTYDFPAGAPVVGVVASGGVSSLDLLYSQPIARGERPRLVFTRRCLIPVAAEVNARPVPDGSPSGSASVSIAPAPWWARCSGRSTWFLPPDAGVRVDAGDGHLRVDSRDQLVRAVAQERKEELQAQVEALRVEQEQLRRAEVAARKAQAQTAARMKALQKAGRAAS